MKTYEMKTYPNQKIIKIEKAPHDDNNLFTVLNLDAYYKAIRELTHIELKIYMYMLANQDGYEFALYTKNIAENTNSNQTSVKLAINSLIEKGYLQHQGGNHYIFKELR